MRRLRMRRFQEELAHPQPGLVQLGFRGADRTTYKLGNFDMFVALNVMQDKDSFKSRRKLINGSLQVDPIDGSHQLGIDSAPFHFVRIPGDRIRPRELLHGGFPAPTGLLKSQQDHVDREPAQPRVKRRFTAEGIEFLEHSEERFLREVFCIVWVARHAKTQRPYP